jgi:hypothetical protein
MRRLTGTFGKMEVAVPRARIMGEGGKTREWKSLSLPTYQRRTKGSDALIAGAYLAGTNTRCDSSSVRIECVEAHGDSRPRPRRLI